MLSSFCNLFSVRLRFQSVLLVFLIGVLTAGANTVSADEFKTPIQQPAIASPFASQAMLLDIAAAGERLVVVGERGYILTSDDQGASWQQRDVPVSITLTAVYFVNPQEGWSVGHGGIVLHTLDAGVTWSVQMDAEQACQLTLKGVEQQIARTEEAAKAGIDSAAKLEELSFALTAARITVEETPWKPLLDVWFRNSHEGFVLGSYGQFFYTDDGGMTWQSWADKIPNPNGYHLNAIAAVGDDLWIAGEAGTLYRSRDGGRSWQALDSPYIGSYFGIVADPGSKEVLAFGLRGNVFRSIDAGDTWDKVSAVGHYSLYGATFIKNGGVVLASAGLLQLSSDGVAPFVALKAPSAAYSSVVDVGDGSLVTVGIGGVRKIKINP